MHVLPISGQQFLNTLLVPSHLPVYSWYFRMSTLSLCWIIMRVVYPRFSFARTSLSSFMLQVCSELGIQMVDGLGIQLLSLTPYTQHYDWGTLVFFSAGTWEWQNSFSARCFAMFCREGFQPKCLEVLKFVLQHPFVSTSLRDKPLEMRQASEWEHNCSSDGAAVAGKRQRGLLVLRVDLILSSKSMWWWWWRWC